MSYSNAHETSNLRTYAFVGGAQASGERVALLRCLRPPSLPDPFSQLSRRAFSSDSRKSKLRPTNCEQSYPRVQREGPRCPKAGLFASHRGPRHLRRAQCPRLAADAPPGSEEVRQRRHLLDTGVCRTGQLRVASERAFYQLGLLAAFPASALAFPLDEDPVYPGFGSLHERIIRSSGGLREGCRWAEERRTSDVGKISRG